MSVKRPGDVARELPVRKQRRTDEQRPMVDWFNDPKYSDVIVKCNGKEFYAHRVVLASRCEFFELCCGGNFVVRDHNPYRTLRATNMIQEASSREINMDDDEPEALEHMLRYLYTEDIDHLLRLAQSEYNIHLFDTLFEVFLLADKYGLPALSELVIEAIPVVDKYSTNPVLAYEAQCTRAYVRVMSLPDSVYAREHLLKAITARMLDHKLPYYSLCLEQLDKDYEEESYIQLIDQCNASVNLTVDAVAANPEAAVQLISMLGNRLSIATRAMYELQIEQDGSSKMPKQISVPEADAESVETDSTIDPMSDMNDQNDSDADYVGQDDLDQDDSP